MSEERFDRIEQRLDKIDGRIDKLDGRIDKLDGRIDKLDGRIDKLESRLDGRIDDLDRHMHVLHEDVITRIAAIPEYTGPTKSEMDQGFADLRETIGRKLDPLEATVRRHTEEIEQLKQARG